MKKICAKQRERNCAEVCTVLDCLSRTYLTAGNEISKVYVSPFCWRPTRVLGSVSSLELLNNRFGRVIICNLAFMYNKSWDFCAHTTNLTTFNIQKQTRATNFTWKVANFRFCVNLPFNWNQSFKVVNATFCISIVLSLDSRISSVVITLDVNVDLFTFSRSFSRVRAEVPVSVERVDCVFHALS